MLPNLKACWGVLAGRHARLGLNENLQTATDKETNDVVFLFAALFLFRVTCHRTCFGLATCLAPSSLWVCQ